MTHRATVPRGHALVDVLDAALAFGALDDAVRDVRAVAAWARRNSKPCAPTRRPMPRPSC